MIELLVLLQNVESQYYLGVRLECLSILLANIPVHKGILKPVSYALFLSICYLNP